MTLASRIQELMSETGWSVGEIAAIAGTSSSAVSQWKDGPTQSIKIEYAAKLAQKCNFNAFWLATGIGNKHDTRHPDDPEQAIPDRPTSMIQIRGTAVIDSASHLSLELFHAGPAVGLIAASKARSEAYAVVVHGQALFPAVRSGWYLVLEPTMQAALRGGDIAMLQLKDGRHRLLEIVALRGATADVLNLDGQGRDAILLEDVQSILLVSSMIAPGNVVALPA